jgi:hypothetical protein
MDEGARAEHREKRKGRQKPADTTMTSTAIAR